MRAYIVFSGTGPILILTTYPGLTDDRLVEKFSHKGIVKFIAYEVPLERVRSIYGVPYEVVAERGEHHLGSPQRIDREEKGRAGGERARPRHAVERSILAEPGRLHPTLAPPGREDRQCSPARDLPPHRLGQVMLGPQRGRGDSSCSDGGLANG